MAQYRIYLSDEETLFINDAAKRLRMRPQDVIRMHISQLKEDQKMRSIDTKVTALGGRVEGLFTLLEAFASEIGYTSGATRAATKSSDVITREGGRLEEQLKRLALAIKNGVQGSTWPQKGASDEL